MSIRAEACGTCVSFELVPERGECAELDIAWASRQGHGPGNEDYVGVVLGSVEQRSTKGSVIAVADGMSGASGGRVAAELAVRGFMEGYYQLPDTLGPEVAGSKALDAVHRWLHQVGRTDRALQQMAASFAALILRGRIAYVIAAGDVRLYLLRNGLLTQVSEDDVLSVAFGAFVDQAVGLQPNLVSNYQMLELHEGDRLLVCTDGVYRRLRANEMAHLLGESSPVRRLTDGLLRRARELGGADDMSAVVVEIRQLPSIDFDYLRRVIGHLTVRATPECGEVVDGFQLASILNDGKYSRIFVARDLQGGGTKVVLKFPKPSIKGDENIRQAVVRERWLSGKITSPYVLTPLPISEDRQTCLYVVMPFIEGSTLEALIRKRPLWLSQGLKVAEQLGHAIHDLNRLNVFHRDIKPENILISPGGDVKLIDLGFAYMPGILAPGPGTPPGSPAYMAPELMRGQPGDARSEVFAMGVTMYRAFSGGHLPYGFNGRVSIRQHCPDLPVWLDIVLEKAMRSDPAARYQTALEFCDELRRYASAGDQGVSVKRRPLMERNPVLFWQLIAIFLLLLLVSWGVVINQKELAMPRTGWTVPGAGLQSLDQ